MCKLQASECAVGLGRAFVMGAARVLWASMRKGRYPLEQVLAQRGLAYQQAELELANARGKLQDAEKALTVAQAAVAEHAAKRAQVVSPEAAGRSISAQALAWSGAYAARLQVEAQKLAARAREAQAGLAAAARAVRLAELTWQRAYAEREALVRHHERFRESERKAIEKAYEIEIEELSHPAHRQHFRG